MTQKGRDALASAALDLSPLCRNILVQVDGKKSFEDINRMFRGLKGLEESIQELFAGNYIEVSRDCGNLVQTLDAKAPALLSKIDDLTRGFSVLIILITKTIAFSKKGGTDGPT